MAFNTTPKTMDAVKNTRWELSGKVVKVVDKYTYLGTITTSNAEDWRPHVQSVIAEAKRRSGELLYLCRFDKGMRPRTAVTSWQPWSGQSWYASEVWSGQIPRYLVQKAESVQMKFLRVAVGLLKKGSGVADEVLC